MAHNGKQSTATSGPTDASRREAGPAPDFALVRPYVATLGEAAPEAHPVPSHRRAGRRSKVSVDPPDATAELIYPPMVGDNRLVIPAAVVRARRWPRFVPLVLTASGVFVIAMIATYLLRTPSGDAANASFARMPATVGSFPPVEASSVAPVVTAAPVGPAHTSKPGTSASPGSATPSASPSTAGPKVVPPTASPSPSPSPAAPVTGQITGIGGLCLDDNGRVTTNGNAIQLYGCNGTSAQSWMVQPDGTVEVLGKCLQVTKPAAGGMAELWDCDHSATEVWRTGANDSFVNVASGLCLDVPSSHIWGRQLDIATCTGAPDQHWTLP